MVSLEPFRIFITLLGLLYYREFITLSGSTRTELEQVHLSAKGASNEKEFLIISFYILFLGTLIVVCQWILSAT